MTTANPRAICLEALNRWEGGSRFSDEILHEALQATPLATLDRALLTEIFYGVLRNLSMLDFLIARLRDAAVDRGTRQVLRIGLYQIFKMRTADHAAVNETVRLAGRARDLVNAVLRRSLREKQELQRALDQAPPSILYSHPKLLVSRWEQQFGAAATLELCRWNNSPAEIYVRANTLKVTPGELLRTAKDAELSDIHPLMIRVGRMPLLWIVNGLCYVQDPSTLVACDLLDPKPGEAVLDACAAPGGKTSYIAQLMQDEGEITACDSSVKRLSRLRENLQRLGASSVKILQHDWLTGAPPCREQTFDKILVDAPCTNTGVIRRRVDVRWRLSREDFERMPNKQMGILKSIAPLLKKGGALVYSSCSIEPEENQLVIERVASDIPELQFVESRQTLPFRDRIDGAFAARFVRT